MIFLGNELKNYTIQNLAPTILNKKFLKTDYPRGRAIEVFRQFHTQSSWAQALVSEPKPKFCILPHPILPKGSSDPPMAEEVNRKPRGKPSGNL